jgi:hypothetical protein
MACLAPRARAADVPITEAARMHFAAGVALLQDPKAPRYEDAYREFKAAYAAAPSYKILGNLGLCAMKIERDAEAINAYETYLNEAGPELTSQEREQIQRDLLTLKAGIVRVTVSSDPPGATILDARTPVEGTDVRNLYGPVLTPLTLALRRGHHVITARMSGYQEQQWEFEASGTTLPPRVFTMTKPVVAADRAVVHDRPTPLSAYVAGGVTLALAATGTIFGLVAIHKHNDFNSLNDGQHVNEANTAKSNGQTLNVITDSLFGGAVVGAVVTSVLVLSRPSIERAAAGGSPSGSVAGSPQNAHAPATSLLPSVSPAWDGRSVGASASWRF